MIAQLPLATLIIPDAVFDGFGMHDDWCVLVGTDGTIMHAGPPDAASISVNVRRVPLPGTTLLPGLVDLHSHLLLHPYDERSWEDQVLRDHEALRVARAIAAARATLEAGFTTLRDLGTEGAGDADVGIKRAIEEGIIPGPRLAVATRAIVASATYGPRGFPVSACIPQGAQEASGRDAVVRAVREQIAAGADWIKLYADYRFGPGDAARPTFTLDELACAVEVAHDAGVRTAAHATTAEGMRRAALAGFDTIEHGNDATDAVFALMAERNVAFCPTLSASEAIARYRGWNGEGPQPAPLRAKRTSFAAALRAGVTIGNGSDVGVFTHGTNAREIALLVDYGMPAIGALRAATSTAAQVLGMADRIGTIAPGFTADILAVAGNPLVDIRALDAVRFVMQAGRTIRYTNETITS